MAKKTYKLNVSFKCPLENTTYHIFATCLSKLLIRTTQHVQGDALHNWKLDTDTRIRESGSQRRRCFRLSWTCAKEETLLQASSDRKSLRKEI